MGSRAISLVRRSPSGKTLKIDVSIDYARGVIEDIVVSGDFFAYPPEKLEELEQSLRGKSLGEALETLESYRGSIELVGISIDDIAELLREAFSRGDKGE